jgi:alkylation response protein AidB-like acyl-CoA dehydrogenase
MGEMGWLGLRIPEALGGAGLGLGEACALAEELGAVLVPEPLVAGMLSVAALAASIASAQHLELADCGHWTALEQPAAVVAAMQSFYAA